MSKYTVQLRYPLTQKLKDLGYSDDEDNWKYAYDYLGLGDYPLFDETYRETLNNKIIRRYYMMEIGFETFKLFSWNMRTRMHEIMPYWNAIYKAQNLIDNPLQSVNLNYSEEWTRDESIKDDIDGTKNSTNNINKNTTNDVTKNSTTQGTNSNTASSATDTSSSESTTADDRNIFEDTPMNGLDTAAIENYDYATNVTFDHSTSSTNSNTDTDTSSKSDTVTSENYNDTEKDVYSETQNDVYADTTTTDKTEIGDYEGTKKHRQNGYDKSQSELLLQYRKAFVNIDLEIVNSLNDMFMLLW